MRHTSQACLGPIAVDTPRVDPWPWRADWRDMKRETSVLALALEVLEAVTVDLERG